MNDPICINDACVKRQVALESRIAGLDQRLGAQMAETAEAKREAWDRFLALKAAQAANQELRLALAKLVNVSLDFDERRQLLRCRICGSERGELGKLHREGCVIYEAQDLLERLT